MDKNYIPKTLEETIQYFDEHLSEEDKTSLKKEGLKQKDGHKFNFSLGHMGLRNAWNLWGSQPGKPNDLYNYFCSIGLPHKEGTPCAPGDDIGAMISTAYVSHLLGVPYDPLEDVKFYVAFWSEENQAKRRL